MSLKTHHPNCFANVWYPLRVTFLGGRVVLTLIFVLFEQLNPNLETFVNRYTWYTFLFLNLGKRIFGFYISLRDISTNTCCSYLKYHWILGEAGGK